MNRHLRSGLSLLVAALLIGAISYLGVTTFKSSHAATGASLYASPDSANVATGSTLSVTLREDSGTAPVNSVQASLNYDSNTLQFVSIAEGDTFPVVAATSTSTPGVIRVGRANADTAVSGDHPVVTVNFKVIGSSGSGAVSFDKAYSFLVRSSDNQDILQNVGSGTYTVTAGASSVTSGSTKPVLYVSPAASTVGAGSTVSVAVRLNSYNTAITTVEAAIAYPVSQLQYIGTTEGGVYTTKQRTNATNGVVDIIRGIAGGSSGILGDNLVVNLSFKVVGNTGAAAALSIGGASAAFDGSGTGQNVLDSAGSAGASYVIAAAGTQPSGGITTVSPSPTSATTATTSITTPSQAATIATSSSSSHVSLVTGSDGSALPQISGNVELSPIIDPAIFAANSNDSVLKVEYYVDGKLISTQSKSPYTYKFDTGDLRNGSYTLVVKTYYSGGTVDTRADKILVKNKVDLAYVTRHFIGNILGIIAILVVLALLMWKLVIPQFLRGGRSGGQGTGPGQPGADQTGLYGFPQKGPLVASDPTVVAPSTAAQTTAALPFSQNSYNAPNWSQPSAAAVGPSIGGYASSPANAAPTPVAPPAPVPPVAPVAPAVRPVYQPPVAQTAAPVAVQPAAMSSSPAPAPVSTPVASFAQTTGPVYRPGASPPPTNRF